LAITSACDFRNTLPQMAEAGRFRGVPLLRSGMPWEMFAMRRRGASRGRPVEVVRQTLASSGAKVLLAEMPDGLSGI
jgi:hypothetical protein